MKRFVQSNTTTGLVLGMKTMIVRGCENVAGKLKQEWKATAGKKSSSHMQYFRAQYAYISKQWH